MIALPFVVFSISLILSLIKKRGLTIYNYILILYTIISFFSILLHIFNYYDNSYPRIDLGFIAPILYCSLLLICISPFKRFNDIKINIIVNNVNEKRYNLVVYSYFAIFLIVLIVSATRIQEIVLSDNLAAIRGLQYIGELESFYNHLSGFPRYISAIASLLSPSSYIMILFLGYNLAVLKKSFIFNLITLLSSMTPLLISINIIDRSSFVYWILSLGLVITIFHRFFDKKAKKAVIIFGSIAFLFIIAYFVSVTVSRFGERDGGSGGGIILYAGQSYINFCRFFNELEHTQHSLSVIFPNISEYLLGEKGYFEQAESIRLESKQEIAVFSTFIGFIMSISGRLVTFIFCFVYNRLAIFMIKRKIWAKISLKYIINIWIVALVPVLGLFAYWYYSTTAIYAIIIWISLASFINNKWIIKKII